jgi:hypothetical protein
MNRDSVDVINHICFGTECQLTVDAGKPFLISMNSDVDVKLGPFTINFSTAFVCAVVAEFSNSSVTILFMNPESMWPSIWRVGAKVTLETLILGLLLHHIFELLMIDPTFNIIIRLTLLNLL